ncbi:phosphatase PAP2 family protein [Robertkochia solimangrovi]|uniref:phosphatase PAP2 family protein n=1 Tax=Robertkochia solimangrovi TaxID=2213046 RepID=UPI00117C98E5|nr:phosphatase PAP2 family protein [Robertkochia solimangrovi]TRZ42801.1 phosphatase PAP2 family protein [Robertkochia solimangrovi]
MLDKLIALDKELFVYLNGMGNENWDAFWMFITNKWSSVPLYVLLLLICIYYFNWKKTLLILVITALMITSADQLANLFKYGFERLRPCHDASLAGMIRVVKEGCGGQFGYFSAHAANALTVATFFSLLFKQRIPVVPYILLVWALVVTYSRIYIGVHFPLDVITGMCFGMLIGWGSYRLFRLGCKYLPLY